MKNYLLTPNKKGYSKETQTVYKHRIHEYAQKGIQALTLLAQNLPEDQQTQIFNQKTLFPLIKAIYTAKNKPDHDPETLQKRKERIQKLCTYTLHTIGGYQNSWVLAPEVMKVLNKSGLHEIPPLMGLKAIIIKSLT
jgi:hypothetical protein